MSTTLKPGHPCPRCEIRHALASVKGTERNFVVGTLVSAGCVLVCTRCEVSYQQDESEARKDNAT